MNMIKKFLGTALLTVAIAPATWGATYEEKLTEYINALKKKDAEDTYVNNIKAMCVELDKKAPEAKKEDAQKIKDAQKTFVEKALEKIQSDQQKLIGANLETTKKLVEGGTNANCVDWNKNTPLHLADNVEIAQYLIDHGANVNAENGDGETPLAKAVEYGVIDLINFFVEQQKVAIKNEIETFKNKTSKNKFEIAKLLLNAAKDDAQREQLQKIFDDEKNKAEAAAKAEAEKKAKEAEEAEKKAKKATEKAKRKAEQEERRKILRPPLEEPIKETDDLNLVIKKLLQFHDFPAKYKTIIPVDELRNKLQTFTNQQKNKSPYLLKIPIKNTTHLIVIGDIHGSAHALACDFLMMQELGYLDANFKLTKNTLFIALGDYGDRGKYSCETYYLLCRLALANEGRVFLCRGNHEYQDVMVEHTTKDECDEKYPAQNIFGDILALCETFPDAIFFGNYPHLIMCCHATMPTNQKNLPADKDDSVPFEPDTLFKLPNNNDISLIDWIKAKDSYVLKLNNPEEQFSWNDIGEPGSNLKLTGRGAGLAIEYKDVADALKQPHLYGIVGLLRGHQHPKDHTVCTGWAGQFQAIPVGRHPLLNDAPIYTFMTATQFYFGHFGFGIIKIEKPDDPTTWTMEAVSKPSPAFKKCEDLYLQYETDGDKYDFFWIGENEKSPGHEDDTFEAQFDFPEVLQGKLEIGDKAAAGKDAEKPVKPPKPVKALAPGKGGKPAVVEEKPAGAPKPPIPPKPSAESKAAAKRMLEEAKKKKAEEAKQKKLEEEKRK